MIWCFWGTDRARARAEMDKALRGVRDKQAVVRVTDASPIADLESVLGVSGMFDLPGLGERRVVILDGVFAREEMRALVLSALARVEKSGEPFFILEEKLDADTRRKLEKHAEVARRFDVRKTGARDLGRQGIFALANALRRGDRKRLWVEYQRALARQEAPEAIHGVLFWGAKQALLAARKGSPEHRRGAALVGELAELPHEARRRGFALEYALEHYLLGINKS